MVQVLEAKELVPAIYDSARPWVICIVCAQLLNAVAIRRVGKPEDIASLVSYLVSDEAGYITGERRDFYTSLRPLTS